MNKDKHPMWNNGHLSFDFLCTLYLSLCLKLIRFFNYQAIELYEAIQEEVYYLLFKYQIINNI